MSPIKSTFGRSVGKLLSVFRDRDLTLNSSVRTNRKIPGLITGGIETTYGSYKVHTFLTSGSLVVSGVPLSFASDVLVVGGGGAGGSGNAGRYEAGGGGGGGMLAVPNHPITSGTFTVTVGDGGTADQNTAPLNYGGYSELATSTPIRSEGGGAGGMSAVSPGGYGGSAGGNRRDGTTPTATAANRVAGQAGDSPAPATPGQGNGGGAAYSSGGDSGGGGGGGANGEGAAGGSNTGGNGGPGRANTYRTGGTTYYAGGGGGIGFSQASGPSGGLGGGGGGGTSGTPGTTNTGGGGGGGANDGPTDNGGDGGPGIVVIRYLTTAL
jgi:hypothetical protein